MKYSFICLLSILLINAGSANSATSRYLKTPEIRQLISGRSMTFYGKHGMVPFKGAAKWSNNGTIKGYTHYLSKTHQWKGRWYVKNNQYCRTLFARDKKSFECHRVKQINANTIQFIKPNGSVSSTTILK